MTYLYYFIVSVFFILFQTVLAPHLFGLEYFYDLFIPFVLYLTLFRPFIEGIPVIFVLGLLLDSLSAGPFGLYGTCYIWLYFSVRGGVGYLHFGNIILLPLVVVLSVALQNILFLGAVFLFGQDWLLQDVHWNDIVGQLIWAGLTGPFLMAGLGALQSGWHMMANGGASGNEGAG
jgi:cell shape-determining protein MreD